jgi:transcriptional regulator with XRE-family HTH domain
MTLINLFGENVRAARMQKGWSQEDLADACELDRTYVSSIERGKRNPTLRVVEQIAHGLGVPAASLLNENFRQTLLSNSAPTP